MEDSKEKGTVYIFTNESFKDNWVKIGKTQKNEFIRAKELSTTSIPLPYKVYATVKTREYSKLEKHIHKVLTDLAKKRIAKNREFFDIGPEKAYENLKDTADLMPDAEIKSPEYYQDHYSKNQNNYSSKNSIQNNHIENNKEKVSSNKKSSSKGAEMVDDFDYNQIFYYKNKNTGCDIKARYNKDNSLTILKNSKFALDTSEAFLKNPRNAYIIKAREDNKYKLDINGYLLEDWIEKKPSRLTAIAKLNTSNAFDDLKSVDTEETLGSFRKS